MDWLRYLLLYGPEFAPIASVAAAAVLLTLTQPEGLSPETSRRRWFAVGTLVFIVLAWRPITEGPSSFCVWWAPCPGCTGSPVHTGISV